MICELGCGEDNRLEWCIAGLQRIDVVSIQYDEMGWTSGDGLVGSYERGFELVAPAVDLGFLRLSP